MVQSKSRAQKSYIILSWLLERETTIALAVESTETCQVPSVCVLTTNSYYSKRMEQDLRTHCCQTKSAKSHDMTSSDSIRDENPCKRAETAISPTQPASTEETHQEKAQETYPWMKEVSSTGTKQKSIFCTCVLKTYTRQLVGVGRMQLLRFLVRISHAAIFPKPTNQISRLLKDSIDLVKLSTFLFGNC